MTNETTKLLVDQMLDAVRGSISKAMTPLQARLAALEAIAPAEPAPGMGPQEIASVVSAEVARAMALLPVPNDGKDGKDGKDGAPGKDAQAVDPRDIAQAVSVEVGLVVAALPVPKDGKDGKDGPKGADGASIHPDTVALMVIDQVRKAVSDLPAPKDGAPGRDGQDAAHLAPLEVLDPDKAYPRGTWATYAGGLICAVRVTDPLAKAGFALDKAGWAVMVEGLESAEASRSEDARRISIKLRRTSGVETIQEFSFPAMVYRNVWRETDYEPGDVVTWSGSSWHCQQTTRLKPGLPESAEAWKLMVKRGADGKDLRDADDPAPPKVVRVK